MRERPILFSGAMVRALLAGTKTQTRRIIKPQPYQDEKGYLWWMWSKYSGSASINKGDVGDAWFDHCPYGKIGDHLWSRETTNRRPMINLLTGEPLDEKYDGGAYSADGEDILNPDGFDIGWWYSRNVCPAIHMPRWASRLLLEITEVRVQRLQDISEEDAIAEGIRELPLQEKSPGSWWCADPLGNQSLHCRTPRAAYARLWESINGPGSWESNPLVWAISFRRINACTK